MSKMDVRKALFSSGFSLYSFKISRNCAVCLYKPARPYGGTLCEMMTPYPRRFAMMLSLGLFAAYTYTFGIAPNNCSLHDKLVFPSGEPGSHSTVPCMPK